MTPRKTSIVSLLLAFVVILSQAFCARPRTDPLDAELRRIQKRHKVVGMSLVVVKGGTEVFSRGYGSRDRGRRLPTDGETVYRIASISKTVTAAALMILYDRGAFQLDDDVGPHLGFPLRNPHFPDDPITFRKLLSHTSSLRDGTGYDGFLEATRKDPAPPLQALLAPGGAHYSADMFDQEHPPSSGYFDYSNVNFGVIGTLVERISRTRFDVFCRGQILEPLRLAASFNVQDLPDINDVAVLYRRNGLRWKPQADHHKGVKPPPRDLAEYTVGTNGVIFGPQGSLRIGASGLARWMMTIMNGGELDGIRILKETTVANMLAPAWTHDGTNGNTDHGLFRAYGLGFQSTGDLVPGTTLQGHPGDAYGLISDMFFSKGRDLGIVFITNGGILGGGEDSAWYGIEKDIFDACLSHVDGLSAPTYVPAWESLDRYECPDWYRDAKFGIFIHWGVYAVPAFGSEWYPRQMYLKDSAEYRHHLETYGSQDRFGYKDFIPLFKAEKFDPDAWAAVFRKSGARYVVPVAEHHDGFAMYGTRLSEWNALKMGPKRDIVGELAAAVRRQGMVFGLSSHRIEHWWFMNGGMKIPSDVQDARFAGLYGPAREEKEPPSEEFMNDWLLRAKELVDTYEPQVFWFDWWIEQRAMESYRKTFAAFYYNRAEEWGKGVVINYKNESFPPGAAVYDIERGSSKATKEYPWQTDTSIGRRSWGYIEGEVNKTPNEIVDDLVDIVSKNGNLLLNVGPRADGTIPEEQVKVLLEIGRWLAVNGEGIYGTRPWRLAGEGPTENPDGGFGEGRRKDYSSEDFRFTSKNGAVYVFCLDIPKGGTLAVKALALLADPAKPVKSISMLGSAVPVKWKQRADRLEIAVPERMPCEHAIGFRVRF